MRRKYLLGLLAALIFPAVCTAAGADLSGMSFEELQELSKKVTAAIMESDGWEEVTVPIGIYKIGEEIPAGRWTIGNGGYSSPYYRVGKTYEGGEIGRLVYYGSLDGDENIILEDGQYMEILNGPVVFRPYVSSFTFKAGKKENDQGEPMEDVTETPADTKETDEKEEKPAEEGGITKGEENALKKARQYLGFMPFSYSGLVTQLTYDEFTQEEAEYAADNCGADWSEQAVKKAEQYLDLTAFSGPGLITQLTYDGFSPEEARYAAEALGY